MQACCFLTSSIFYLVLCQLDFEERTSKFWSLIRKYVSSATRVVSKLVIVGRSLTYNKNKSGPSENQRPKRKKNVFAVWLVTLENFPTTRLVTNTKKTEYVLMQGYVHYVVQADNEFL